MDLASFLAVLKAKENGVILRNLGGGILATPEVKTEEEWIAATETEIIDLDVPVERRIEVVQELPRETEAEHLAKHLGIRTERPDG